MANERGLLIILSGPSGVGKDTLIDLWLQNNRRLARLVTCTTRAPRPWERHGIDYYFMPRDAFDQMAKEDAFFEHKTVHDNQYGTPRKEMERLLDEGKDVILKIDVQGGIEAKRHRPEALMIFVQAPSMEVLERRLRQRMSETDETIANRMRRAKDEMAAIGEYAYLVTNDAVEPAVRKLQAIIIAEHSRVGRAKVAVG